MFFAQLPKSTVLAGFSANLVLIRLDLTSSVTTACENGAFRKTRLQFLLQHTVTSLSNDLETMRAPSGENAAEVTTSSCPRIGGPTASHMCTVLSCDTETIRVENGTQSSCPRSGPTRSPGPDTAFRIREVLSADLETIRVPSGENAAGGTTSMPETALNGI
jgi:hypothetical protein